MRIIAGIDSGLDGGVAVLNEYVWLESAILPTMGDKPRVIDGGALARWLGDRDVREAIIEDVHAHPNQGVTSTFRFGVAFGQILGVLQTSLIPYSLVTPQRWKKHFSLIGKDKDEARRRAIERFPHAADQFERKMDIHRADAALLAQYWLETSLDVGPGDAKMSPAMVTPRTALSGLRR
jgi:crossover junction endodeoxyribonuclease RuvC